MQFSWRKLVPVAALGLAAMSLTWTARAETAPPGRGVIVSPGLVEPFGEERQIGSPVIGVISEMRVEENDEVAAGQILAVIDNAEQVARLAAARAELAQRRAELDRANNGATQEERREARANLAEAVANRDNARREYDRRAPLVKSGATPREVLDQAESIRAVAEARHAAATERLAALEAGSRPEDIAAARARAALAEANVGLAEAMLDKTIIRSPIAGVVLRRDRVVGEAVTNLPPTPIAIIGDLNRLRVRAEVDETDAGRVAAGQKVEVAADAYPERRFGGTVFRVSPRLGGKTVQTGRPTDRVDAKVLQVLIDLDAGTKLPIGLRVDAYFSGAIPSPKTSSAIDPPKPTARP